MSSPTSSAPPPSGAAGGPTLDPSRWLEDHGDALYRFALLRLRNPELAEDAVQETFMAALRGAANFRGGSSERTWLIGILKRKVIDHFRKRYREQPISQLSDFEDGDAGFEALFSRFGHWKRNPGSWGGDPSHDLNEAEFMGVLRGCLEALPGRQGEAFVLREMEQMDSKEICQVLNVTPSNLWALLHRARTRLRGCIAKNWFQRGPDNE
jgi:RNA polymerase sigma-70 factor (ECF subfamily)